MPHRFKKILFGIFQLLYVDENIKEWLNILEEITKFIDKNK